MKALRLKNIKSFMDSGKVEIKPITIFVGKNSCGKSSLIRFPVIISQTMDADSDSPIAFYGKKADYGIFEDVLRHGSNGQLTFELTYDVDVSLNRLLDKDLFENGYIVEYMSPKDKYKKEDVREVTLSVVLCKIQKKIRVSSLSLLVEEKNIYEINRVNKETYSFNVHYNYKAGDFIEQEQSFTIDNVGFEKFVPCFDIDEAIEIIYRDINGEESNQKIDTGFILDRLYFRREKYIDELSDKEKRFLEEWDAYDYAASLLRRVFSMCQKESDYLRYIGPFRANPERYYRDLELFSTGVGVHGENTSNILIGDSQKKDPKLIYNISRWTKEVLGYEIVLKDISNGMFQIMLRDSKGVETNLIDNGYGISQVLPIVTEVTRLQTNRTPKRLTSSIVDMMTIIEQPELHLHPAAQSELANLFVDSVLTGKGKKKMLIETHSEHLIRKIQLLVADRESLLTNDMVAIYYIDKDKDGFAIVEEMKLLKNGKFEKTWPSGFFDKGYQLSRALAKAGKAD